MFAAGLLDLTERQVEMYERLSAGKPVIGDHPDCICNGDTVDLWDCPCPDCKELQDDFLDQFDPDEE